MNKIIVLIITFLLVIVIVFSGYQIIKNKKARDSYDKPVVIEKTFENASTTNEDVEQIEGTVEDTTNKQDLEQDFQTLVPEIDITCTKETPNYSTIFDYIQKNIDTEINEASCYIKEPNWDGQFIYMDVHEKIGDFSTNSLLTISIRDGKIKKFINHLKEFNKDIEVPEFDEEKTIEKAKNLAIGGSKDKVDEQTIIKQYDIEAKKFYIYVKTVFQDSEGLFYGTEYEYEVK